MLRDQEPPRPEVLSAQEFADRLGVGVKTVYRRIRSGRIRAVDANAGGGRATWRIPSGELDRLVFTPPAEEAEQAVAAGRPSRPAPVKRDAFGVRPRRAA